MANHIKLMTTIMLAILLVAVFACAADVSVRARKVKKPVKIAYVKQITPNRWEMGYGTPANPTEFIVQFNGSKRTLLTDFCEFEFVWK